MSPRPWMQVHSSSHWSALTDLGLWVGGPESSAVPSPQATSSTTSTTSTTSTPTNSTSNPVSGTSHKLNVGAIAGGVVGGVVVVGMAGLIAFLILRKRSRAVPIPSTHNLNGYTSQPMMSDDGEIRYNSTTPEVPAISNMNLSDPGKLYVSLVQRASLISYPDGLTQDPNLKGPSTFPLAFTGYNPYSDSPQQSSPHTRGNSYSSLTALSARTQYAGVPELWYAYHRTIYITFHVPDVPFPFVISHTFRVLLSCHSWWPDAWWCVNCFFRNLNSFTNSLSIIG